MGVSSSKELIAQKGKYISKEKKELTADLDLEKEKNKNENISNIFQKEEIDLINKRKAEKDQEMIKALEINKDTISPLYQKLIINLTKKENTVTNYMVLYAPKDFSQLKTLIYSYFIRLNRTVFIFKEKYTKVTNNPKVIKGIGIESREEAVEDLPCIKSNIEFIITEKDIKNGFIILETSYNIFIDSYYGFYEFYTNLGKDNIKFPKSVLFIINDNFITKNDLFAFNQERYNILIEEKNIKINIRDEVNKELLSAFSDKDIEKINYALNLRKWKLNWDNLIFHKVIHNIKNKKDFIKYYCIVFSPSITGSKDGMGAGGYQPIIIKEFKINNNLVKNKTEDNDSENSFDNYGYYISDENQTSFRHQFKETFSVCELTCESNEKEDYFLLNFGSFIDGIFFEIGNTFYYEIILNGNSI